MMSSRFQQLDLTAQEGLTQEPGSALRTRHLVEIDSATCERLATIIKNQPIPMDREETSPPAFSREEIGNYYLCLVALCHQTTPRGKPPLEGVLHGEHRRGWDYLSGRLEEAFGEDAALFTPSRWTEISGHELTTLFSDSRFGNRLTEPDKRAALLRDLGHVMLSNQWEWAEDFYNLSRGTVAAGQPNLLDVLAEFSAYRDPVRKKSYFFLSLMRNSGLWQYTDSHLLGPPVDYHETRGHLRLGTVVVKDNALQRKLSDSLPVTEEEDLDLRTAVHDAIMLISDLTGLRNPSQLHYLFWNVFRSCCSRESPHCNGCPPDCPLPERYVHLAIHSSGPRRCAFSEICATTCTTTHNRYYEHVFDTDYY
jgi:hypothetical protein